MSLIKIENLRAGYGPIDVLHDTKPKVPLVIRLSGTEAEAGRALLEGASLVSRATMDDAATEAVRLAGRGGKGEAPAMNR